MQAVLDHELILTALHCTAALTQRPMGSNPMKAIKMFFGLKFAELLKVHLTPKIFFAKIIRPISWSNVVQKIF